MSKDVQVRAEELSALMDLAWRAPMKPAEVLWLRSISERIAAIAEARTQSTHVKEEE